MPLLISLIAASQGRVAFFHDACDAAARALRCDRTVGTLRHRRDHGGRGLRGGMRCNQTLHVAAVRGGTSPYRSTRVPDLLASTPSAC